MPHNPHCDHAASLPTLQVSEVGREVQPHTDMDVLLSMQQDLAASYRAIAETGTAWFYGGAYAQKVEAWMKENGGIMTAADFTNYKAVEREAVRAKYRGYDIVAMPPPSRRPASRASRRGVAQPDESCSTTRRSSSSARLPRKGRA